MEPVKPGTESEQGKEQADLIERLDSIDEFQGLTDLNKRIIVEKLKNPEITVLGLAKKAGCSRETVHKLFRSEAYDSIDREFAIGAVRGLRHLAASTLKKAMLSDNIKVATDAAVRVLHSEGILKDAAKEINKNTSISVSWGNKNPIDAAKIIEVGAAKLAEEKKD